VRLGALEFLLGHFLIAGGRAPCNPPLPFYFALVIAAVRVVLPWST
jgi:hypothetical protein